MMWLVLFSTVLAWQAPRRVHSTQDELLWTKQAWAEYTLEVPWPAFTEQAERIKAKGLTSLEGPYHTLPDMIEDAKKRAVPLHPETLFLAQVHKVDDRGTALSALSCQTCQQLMLHLWDALVPWVNAHGSLPPGQAVTQYAWDLCAHEVPVSVLKSWSLFQTRVKRTLAWKQQQHEGEGAEGSENYTLTRRHDQHATPLEMELEGEACRALLEPPWEAEAGGLLPDLRRQLEEYLGHVQGAVSAEGALDTDAALDADDSLALDQSCVDRHPQCELWAAKGECRANPVYMIGKGGAVAQCARACATCTRPAPPLPAFLLGAAEPARAQEAAREAARLGQASLVRGGCLAREACGRLQGGDAEAALLEALQAPAVPAGRPGGGGRASQALASELVQSQVMLVRGAKDPVIPASRGPPRTPASATSPGSGAGDAERVLWDAVGGKCLYVSTGWWLYEVCPGWRASQFHLSAAHVPDWVIPLGAAPHGWGAWVVAAAPRAALLPGAGPLPALETALEGGGECDRGAGGAGTGAAPRETVARRATLRALCSPDAAMHVVVQEPVQCEYLIELYVPELCPVFEDGTGDGGEEVVEEEGGVVVILGEDGALPQREGGAQPEQAAEAEEAEDVMDAAAWDEL
ncbi:hypothetical protein ACKKBG_A25575 [Auxenochlorella protothecoides x Auxenochlorella symbiontica]